MEIRPLTEEERRYTYTQSAQLLGQTGCIGHLRGDFDRSGNGFFTSWDDHRKEHKTDQFKKEFDDVINTLRTEKYGLLQNRIGMRKYASLYPDSAFWGNYCTEYGFRVDTGNHSYLIRCNPTPGDYNFYCYCYVTKYLNQHLHNAEQGIRFLDEQYNEAFRIADGGKIVITDCQGKKEERICRYIDEYHAEIGCQLYHINQFAELMKGIGSTYEAISRIEPDSKFTIINGIEVDLTDYVEDENLIRRLLADASFKNDVSFAFEKEFSWADDDISGDEILKEVVAREIEKRKPDGRTAPSVDTIKNIPENAPTEKYYVYGTISDGSKWYLATKDAVECTLWSNAPVEMRAVFDSIEEAKEKVNELAVRWCFSSARYDVEQVLAQQLEKTEIPAPKRKGR